jgi:hypothetical protein
MSNRNAVTRIKDAICGVTEKLQVYSGIKPKISDNNIVLIAGMSRSGTTLLATVIDSHPEIVCGAELLPSFDKTISEVLNILDSTLVEVQHDFTQLGKHLRERGHKDIGLFFVRCHRAGLNASDVRAALSGLIDLQNTQIQTVEDRLRVANALIEIRAHRENAAMYGFKYTSSNPELAAAYFPNAKIVCIVRDPYDVVLSHQKRNFEKSTEEISKSWSIFSKKYRNFSENYPDKCYLVRYEDLVSQPRRALKNVFRFLELDLIENIFRFYESDSPIHKGFHPNSEQLSKNFFTNGMGIGRSKLLKEDLKIIENKCSSEINEYGYKSISYVKKISSSMKSNIIKIGKLERLKMQAKFSNKRKFSEVNYHELLQPYINEYEFLSLGDYVREHDVSGRKIMLIRHDIDHDLDTAVKIAKWEALRGIRSTFCVLHTAWYYGALEDQCYRHSDFLVNSIAEIKEYGHEINFHNNLIALSLRNGLNPIALLESELDFYDQLGVSITGTSTHGDELCRQLNFRNWEIFKDCCDEKFGGPRIVENFIDGRLNRCELGSVSMNSFGLEYEAYDIAKDVYHTESGGNMRRRELTFGRRPFGRRENDESSICGILTHPIWWKF